MRFFDSSNRIQTRSVVELAEGKKLGKRMIEYFPFESKYVLDVNPFSYMGWRRLAGVSSRLFGALFILFSLGSSLHAQTAIPDNAAKSVYGDGWECKAGFFRNGEECLAVQVPEGAYLTGKSYGSGWACHRGFEEDRDQCLQIAVPENAYLNSSGTGWNCARGFYRTFDQNCVPVIVPQNAYLS